MTSTISTTSAARPVVLIADDLTSVLGAWIEALRGYDIDVVAATDLADLLDVYSRHRDELAAIILDGCMPGDTLNTLGFIMAVRAEGFTKPMVAASSSDVYRARMMAVGCSHQAPKGDAADLVADLLSAP